MLNSSRQQRRAVKRRKRTSMRWRRVLSPTMLLGFFSLLLLLSLWALLFRQVTVQPTIESTPRQRQPLPTQPRPTTLNQRGHHVTLLRPPSLRKNKKSQNNNKKKVPTAKESTKHEHVIPNILIFTHYQNLLNATTKLEGEDVVLAQNVRNTIQLHPGAQVYFYTDDDCIASIQRVMGKDSPLVNYFQKETKGMYKADICRGAALYETGGLYFDVDLQARMSLWNAVGEEATFVVPRVHVQSKYPGAFFQAFIGVTPQNVIMKRYLELFVDHYQGHLNLKGGPLGVLLLRMAHDDVLLSDENVELWQEVLWNKKLFPNVPAPSWGTRRACHFVVVANSRPPFVVPFYSRVRGSRMCGGKDSQKLRGHK